MKLTDLVPDRQNRRLHNDRNIGMVVEALQTVGPARSIVIDEDNVILAGNGVTQAAAQAGITNVRVVDVAGDELVAVRRVGLTPAEKRALAIYDNRTSELATWNLTQLEQDQAAGLSLQPFWTADEAAGLITVRGRAGRTDPDAIPEPRHTAIAVGDVFALGPHRLVCGDATDPRVVAAAVGAAGLDFVVTSPPYNVGMQYRTQQDRTDRATYLAFIRASVAAFVPHLRPGRFVAWNVGVSPKTCPAHQVVVLEDGGLTFYRQIVWQKSGVAYPIFQSTRQSKRVRHYKPNYTHEIITLFVLGEEEYGATQAPDDRYQNDVWAIHQSQATVDLKTIDDSRSATLQHDGQPTHRLKEHPAAFPVELPRALLSYLTGPGETVCDPFSGSGSTLIACEQMDRCGVGIEFDPVYCQIQIDRWEAFTGQTATKVGTR